MSGSPHTTFPKGSKIFVRMKDKTSFEDHFEERTGKFILLRSGKKLRAGDVQSIGYAKDRNVSLPNRDESK
jgi:hypothetical protein